MNHLDEIVSIELATGRVGQIHFEGGYRHQIHTSTSHRELNILHGFS